MVCWKKAGEDLTLGEKFGLIKFSSRTDLQMPFNVDLTIKVDDKVKGGETVIGKIKD
ncbi:MAG: phosphatidylserine decarboxylase [Pyrinomonadaceae bacterium]